MAGDRTEQPTAKRRQKARQDGQFPLSRDLYIGVQFTLFVAVLTSAFTDLWISGLQFMRQGMARAFAPSFHSGTLLLLTRGATQELVGPMVRYMLLLLLLPLVVYLASTQGGISLKKLRPDPSRLNPLSRLSQMFGQNAMAAVSAALFSVIGGLALWHILRINWDPLPRLVLVSLPAGLAQAAAILRKLLWQGASILMLFGLVDYARQRRRWQSQLRMTKQEVRDEHKEAEGSPEMKMRVRRIRRDLLRRRMMQQVPQATAVIVNPTHYAVAIRYDMNGSGAPLVVAKGKNYLALRIKQKAIEHDVPIVENPPLAQALYKSVEVGQEIPPHLYRAVAEILAYIFRLMKGTLPR